LGEDDDVERMRERREKRAMDDLLVGPPRHKVIGAGGGVKRNSSEIGSSEEGDRADRGGDGKKSPTSEMG
jgi:hypothetical protein